MPTRALGIMNANEIPLLRSAETIPLILSGPSSFHCDPSGTHDQLFS